MMAVAPHRDLSLYEQIVFVEIMIFHKGVGYCLIRGEGNAKA